LAWTSSAASRSRFRSFRSLVATHNATAAALNEPAVHFGAVCRAPGRCRDLGFGWQRWGSSDNALAETINGLYKTELIKHRGPWRTVEQVEFATAEWVDWFNYRRLYEYCGDIPPAELEAAYYIQTQPHHPVGSSETK
jgi:hypothetical protein